MLYWIKATMDGGAIMAGENQMKKAQRKAAAYLEDAREAQHGKRPNQKLNRQF